MAILSEAAEITSHGVAGLPGTVPAANLIVRLELSYRCNLRCRMCDFSLPKAAKEARAGGQARELPGRIFRRICTEVLPYASECILGVRGEPLTARNFEARLLRISEIMGPAVTIHTNGTLMTQQLCELLCDLGIGSVIISVDGACKETFEHIRVNANFDALIGNVRRLLAIRGIRKCPAIQWNFVIMRRNLRELPALITLASEIGVECVHAFHMIAHDALGIERESCVHCPEESNQVLAMATTRAQRLGINFIGPKPFSVEQMPLSPYTNLNALPTEELDGKAPVSVELSKVLCECPWKEVVVNQNGRVFPCVFWYKDAPMGDLSSQPFLEVWNGLHYRKIRSMSFFREARTFSCAYCPVTTHRMEKCGSVVNLSRVLLP